MESYVQKPSRKAGQLLESQATLRKAAAVQSRRLRVCGAERLILPVPQFPQG